MTVSNSNGLPDIVSVQKRLYPLIFTQIVSEQPTTQPVATAFGFKSVAEADDASGWLPHGFRLDRWYAQVQSSKLKTEISLETIQDMQALGVNESIITDSIADQIADDINTNIIDALNSISTVGSAITLSGITNRFDKGRELYSLVHASAAEIEKSTGCTGTYIVAGGEAFGLLTGTGMATQIGDTSMYKCDSGLYLVHDKYATTDYVTIGVKKELGDYEISSLVFSPYNFDKATDAGIAYQYKTQDSKSFHPIYGVIARYALTVAPLEDNQTGAVEIDWDNLGVLANSSKLSYTHAVTV
ncbi:head vertex protein [Vibrio phage VH7D]|uniref:Head vertex protein n=1 Tax=Vibrio phage VH7D TaxID=1262539 RepID=V9LZG6_9CAUD|nr:head vertex protein [Vibrio phage VH7D]AGB07070.1 head vertex protein [Vibrio phage VH7D]QNJ54650.1 head vertex protein [Vibrio phage vB_ValM_R10Z]QNJ55036.1 head vertex protein [Vibrio phage vB_ValM_R11Z]